MAKKKKIVGKNKRGAKKIKYGLKRGRKKFVKESVSVYDTNIAQLPQRKILSNINQKPYFYKDNFVLYHGDCLEILGQLPDESIDMVFADPPYNLSNGGFTVHAGRRVSVNKGDWDKSKGINSDYEFHLKWLAACKRVLNKNGTLWVSGTYHSIYQCGYAIQSLGYHILNDIAWFKPTASPNLSCRYFTASHETLIWARKNKEGKHTFNYDDMRHKKWPDDFFKNDNKQMRSVWHIPEGESVWVSHTPPKEEKFFGKHPTQKPLALLNRIILASTKEGDIILDPFTGSSTTGLSSIQNDRKFIGIDKDEDFLELSQKRFEELSKNNKSKLL